MSSDNKYVTFHGNRLTLTSAALKVGDTLPAFTLTAQDMSDLKSDLFKGKILIIATVPSLDTPTCAIETKRFEQTASKLSPAVEILSVSRDLPFAQKRWCGSEGVSKVKTGSDYKYRTFGSAFGVQIEEWGLLARAVFVADKQGRVAYVEYVSNISDEPNYDAALKVVSSLLEK